MDVVEQGKRSKILLEDALIREAMAVFKYMVFAKQAEKDGYRQIAAAFREIAMQEFEHGKLWFDRLGLGGKNTEENIIAAMTGERDETRSFYPGASDVAKEEGYSELSERFKEIGEVENVHMGRFLKFFELIKSGEFFIENDEIKWRCRNCGYVTTPMLEAPEQCPACLHGREYFERA